ncbi:MAG: DUF4445 domain-containing protein [Anaerolineae bacterium]|jgi:uncharacterized 2Fe-2S/4Fe-4S cluster protein (DUF4445 family)|nr:DUF4445 domain-containing protein [Anaerolineae bacterium]MBT4459687.1 DUF4445 domain-containing protein [Anaerolineae bacterium]MBT4841543.1 DUF4445 domain-containing protein [Anaerolineae bacterium]MBT6063026.1 DUF4445 domain-containing protein [Anaerolineae bacterium]MBT6320754.1 DUF4445 domain-containing protein [Anaerolineae bacterium]
MAEHIIKFDIASEPVSVPTGTMISEAAEKAGIEINQPCGGQGRCGRCAVQVTNGDENIRRRSTLRLSAEDVKSGYALACQSVIEGDVEITIPPQEKIERRLTTDRTVGKVEIPAGYDPEKGQTLRRVALSLSPPSMDDQTDDWSRLKTALRKETGITELEASLACMKKIGRILREDDWKVTATLNSKRWDCPDCPAQLLALDSGHIPEDDPLWGVAIDIGTTTVSVWMVDLLTGEVKAQAAEYNQQISRGEDVISRIIVAGKEGGSEKMRDLVVDTINELLQRASKRVKATPNKIMKATISGNSTMMHLLLGIPASSIRLSPFVTAVNHIPTLDAIAVGLILHPQAIVDCLPGVASYVGADISAGVLSSGMTDSEDITLFLDVGTNGEMVLGSKDWLVTCACSAGPAFEGAGVLHGMRATKGAIEEVWVNAETYEPNFRVIGNTKAKGLCGSGLISLLAEMFLAGVINKGGKVNLKLATERTREGEHGGEYVIAWADETSAGKDIVITNVDIDNLLRAKAAIYAGFAVLAENVGVTLDMATQVLVGGSFGKYINVEKAIEIGLLPDLPWERFHFLGNTSVMGSYQALLDHEARDRITEIAASMTYIELSADNKFYDAFMSAMFLPHTDMTLFPSVAKMLEEK